MSITKEELENLVKQQAQTIQALNSSMKELEKRATKQPGTASKRIIKRNTKGGIFISDPKMKAFSETKGKDYQCGINIHQYQLKAFWNMINDDGLMADIKKVFKSEGVA